jgi:hypothetical protein
MMKLMATTDDSRLIRQIADRVFKEIPDYPDDRLSLEMDLTAAHLNGNPLKLAELLKAPKFDFVHDVCGIRTNLSRTTGKLGNCFSPRYSKGVSDGKAR